MPAAFSFVLWGVAVKYHSSLGRGSAYGTCIAVFLRGVYMKLFVLDGGIITTKDIEDVLGQLTASVSPRIGHVTILASAWVGTESPYSQVVAIDGVTENSQIDLTPSVEQLAIFHEKDLAFVTENDGGVVTVYAVGQKPENDYTIQVTITEVVV